MTTGPITIGSIVRATACLLCLLGLQPLALAADPPNRVMVQGFENAAPQAEVWVVNIREENASLELSSDRHHRHHRSDPGECRCAAGGAKWR